MHLRIRSGYDKTIADSWRAKVAEVEAERDELKARLAHAEAEAEQAIHNEAFSERQRIVAWIRAKHLMLSSLAIANCIEQGEHEE
jgi:predicted secreted protein